jgi:phage terminase Nu1 subunit (DNA packaging protein)
MSRKLKEMRWNKELAASEFGINPRTLTDRIRKYGILAGKDKKFSTRDICSAVFGDIDAEKLREVKERADKLALENAEHRGELVDVKRLAEAMNRPLSAMRSRIASAVELLPEEREELGRDIQKLYASIFEVAGHDSSDAQSAAASNG